MTVSPDMRRNLKELTKTINEFNKTIKKLSKMHREKMAEGKDDKAMFKALIKKQTLLDNAYEKYHNLVQQVSPSDIIPVPLSPTASSSSSRSSEVSEVGPFHDIPVPSVEDLQRRFEALQRRSRSRSRSQSRSRSRSRGSTRSRSRGGRKTRRQRKK